MPAGKVDNIKASVHAHKAGLLTYPCMSCRCQVPYLMHVNVRVHPFSRGCNANLLDYFAWRRERQWELPSTQELLRRHTSSSRVCDLW